MKQLTIGFVVLGMSVLAYGGKQERDLVTKEVAPAISTMQGKLKSQCGCDVKVTLDDSALKTMDELRGAKHMAEHITEGVEKYCSDAPSKKAICQMTTLTLTKGKPAGFTFKSGAGVATTDGQSSCSWEQITRELDK